MNETACLPRGTSSQKSVFHYCGSEKKQRLFLFTALSDYIYNRDGVCLMRGTFGPRSVFLCFITVAVCLLLGTLCRNIVFMSDYFTVQH
jgi:hypothetical protein